MRFMQIRNRNQNQTKSNLIPNSKSFPRTTSGKPYFNNLSLTVLWDRLEQLSDIKKQTLMSKLPRKNAGK